MMDSLAYRNDAAVVLRRLARSLPRRAGVLGIATCDKGLPAMTMALAALRDDAVAIVPGGVTLPARSGEDAGRIQSLGSRYAHGEVTLEAAAELGCRACASPGGGCQFLGTAASSQVMVEALGLAVPHAALAPSGQPVWRELARRSARALWSLRAAGTTAANLLTDASVANAMAVHAAFGGSTNMLLHLPAVAHAARLRRPGLGDWIDVCRRVPRLVDALPNGPRHHPTVQVFLAGGVPEVMLHLRDAGLLDLHAPTVAGVPVGQVLSAWEGSPRRRELRRQLEEKDGVDPDDVIMSPAAARSRGLAGTVCFPRGNLAPDGSVVKSTAIDGRLLHDDGVYRLEGRARVFVREADAIAAIKGRGPSAPRAGEVLVLAGRGPRGAGMEEIYQVTAALRHLSSCHEIAVITDARFSGVTTGPCIGHVSPEALAGGPIGRVRDGDRIRIEVDTRRLEGRVDLVGDAGGPLHAEAARRLLASRDPHPGIAPDPALPDDTRLWAALQDASGGPWGGSVVDVDRVVRLLEAGRRALDAGASS
jgi:putative YjhG/YagF family dehydratase